jgi:endonuclease/exonuclease/phosphatase family metal-dependent hydrolase
MTRITSYNILAGGYDLRKNTTTERTQQLVTMIRSTQPDIVGIAEGINPMMTQRPLVIEEIAKELNMQLVVGSHPASRRDFQTALMTKLPIVYKKVHVCPGVLTRPVLEVCVEETNGDRLVVFVVHLVAAFNSIRAGDPLRMREIREIIRIMAEVKDMPHAVMGDFNSIAPGDSFKASFLLRYLAQLDSVLQPVGSHDGHPRLGAVVPHSLRFLNPLLSLIPRSMLLSIMVDFVSSLLAPRGTIGLLRNAGYVDSYRRIHPHALGFTCPSASPAGRIDFIFANPIMAHRLETCYTVLDDGNGLPGSLASDHLAVSATFGLAVKENPETQTAGLMDALHP